MKIGFTDFLFNLRSYRFKSIYVRILVAFLIISLLMVAVVGFFSYSISAKSISAKITKKNSDMLFQIKQTIDDEMQKLNLIVMNIAHHDLLMNDFDDSDIDTQIDVSQSFFDKFIIPDYVKSVDLYYINSKILISSSKGYSNAEDEELWKSIQMEIDHLEFGPVYLPQLGIKDNSNGELLFVVMPFPRGMNKHGLLSCEIHKQNFFDVVFNEETSERSILIIDSENSLVWGDEEYYKIIVNELKNNSIGENNVFENSKLSVLVKKSSVNEWRYISVQNREDLNREINHILMLTIIVMLICLAIAFLVWAKISVDWYKPILSLIKKVTKSEDMELVTMGRTATNEIELIDNILEQMSVESKDAVKLYDYDRNEIKKGILMSLCMGEMSEAAYIEENLKTIKIPATNSSYMVVGVVMEEVEQTSIEDISAKSIEGIRAFVKRYVDESLNKSVKAVSTYMDNQILIVLVAFNGTKEYLVDNIRAIQNSLCDEYKITTTFGVGESCFRPDKISDSYLQAVNALNYKIFTGKGCVIDIGDISVTNATEFEPYKEKEKKIIEMIKSGNEEWLIGFFDEVCTKIPRSMVMVGQITEILWQIVNYLFVCLISMGYSYNDIYGISYGACYKKYKELEFVNEKCEYIKRILGRYFEYLKECKNRVPEEKLKINNEIVDMIKTYVCHHLDGDLTINTVASIVHYTPAYASKVFKEVTGENFSDYVRKKRMDKARQMLCETELDLNRISLSVGYENVRSFLRAFKSCEGMTPSEYRKKSTINKL
ncbi:MAG: helix-turn-helix domain-containing protein [Clostridia bacterium]|nr:helix-turn-helix domain-containing protein [Clostridia bacterium]